MSEIMGYVFLYGSMIAVSLPIFFAYKWFQIRKEARKHKRIIANANPAIEDGWPGTAEILEADHGHGVPINHSFRKRLKLAIEAEFIGKYETEVKPFIPWELSQQMDIGTKLYVRVDREDSKRVELVSFEAKNGKTILFHDHRVL